MLEATIETTIERLRRCGFAVDRIADLLGVDSSVVVRSLPHVPAEADLSWLPTERLRRAGQELLVLRRREPLEIGARAEEYAEAEIFFLRQAIRHGMAGVRISAAMARLSNPRSVDSISNAAKRLGIVRLPSGSGRRRRSVGLPPRET